jgi:nitroreductase
MKHQLKAALQRRPSLWNAYWRVKQEALRLWMLRFYAYDVANTYRAMYWVPGGAEYRAHAAALLFQFHKLEKGMSMPGARRLFGIEPAAEVMQLLSRWERAGHSTSDTVYLGALETLRAYALHLAAHQLDGGGRISPQLEEFVAARSTRAPHLVTPTPLHALAQQAAPSDAFAQLALARRSVRDFKKLPVPPPLLQEAVRLAQLSPSACNRQPCRVYAVEDSQQMARLLSYQNGNRGFGDRVPLLLIVTADARCFFDASERHQPYIDGGLFSMSLCYGLTALGLASCCLNWCVPTANDLAVHRITGIPSTERIIMFIAVGYASDQCQVPRSSRRDLHDVLSHWPYIEVVSGATGAQTAERV